MNLTKAQKTRESNLELLRVVSMLFVLMVHSNYMGILSVYDSAYNIETFIRFLVESVAIVGVNCFILISGYFGINLRKESVANIVFQTYFFSLLGLIIYILSYGVDALTASVLKRSLFPLTNYIWFLPCYLLLMFFTPIMNSWLRQTAPKKIILTISLIYIITYYWEVIWGKQIGFGGYTFGFFIILYITGHLISRYKEKILPYKWCWGGIYAMCNSVALD